MQKIFPGNPGRFIYRITGILPSCLYNIRANAVGMGAATNILDLRILTASGGIIATTGPYLFSTDPDVYRTHPTS